MNNIFWFDCETTGLDENRNDIIQLAGIVAIDKVKQKPFNEFCQPVNWNNIDPYAVKVHGITPDKMKTFQSQEEMLNNLIGYLDSFGYKFVLAGYNVDFDRRFLSALFTRLGRSADFIRLFELSVHDTYRRAKAIGKKKLGTDNLKLETLCKVFNIEIEAHEALSDIDGTISLDSILAGIQGENTDIYKPKIDMASIKIKNKLPKPVELHIHTQFSSLDGTLTPEDWLKFCDKQGIRGISFTDQCYGTSLHRAIRAKEITKNVTCIPGLGLYIKMDSDEEVFTINCWATTNKGYYNLIKLSSLCHDEVLKVDKKEYPYVTLEQLEQHKEGLKFGTACVRSPMGAAIKQGEGALARKRLEILIDKLGDTLYVEFSPVDIIYQFDKKTGFKKVDANAFVTECNLKKAYNLFMADCVDDFNLNCVPTNGASFIDSKDKIIQDCLRKNGNKDDSYYHESYHFRHTDQLYKELKVHLGDWLTEAKYIKWVENTYDIATQAEQIDVTYEPHLPEIEIPSNIKAQTEDYNQQTYLYMMERIKKHGRWIETPEYIARFEKEIDVIMKNKTMNFIPYFLVYDDISEFARDAGFLQNIARGSAGGALVSYYLQIIHVDPVKENLPFERFLSHARINAGSWPDIDMDISKTARPIVMKYLKEKYKCGFAQVSTHSTIKTKNAIKDVMWMLYGRNRNDQEIAALCKTIPDSPQEIQDESHFLYGYTDQEGEQHKGQLEQNPMLQNFFKTYPDVENMVSRMIGIVRGYSRHASAFIIASIDLSASRVPVFRMWDSHMNDWIHVSHYKAEQVESVGLCKSDLLGLKCLSAVTECIALVPDIDYLETDESGMSLIYRLPEDNGVYIDFYKKKTDSSFQYNSPTIKDCIQEFSPVRRSDLMALTALKRPGAMDNEVEEGVTADQMYLDVRNGKREMSLIHDDLKPYLGDTNGVCVYQEQIMAILVGLCGYSIEDTDIIRSAIAKKKTKVMLAAFDRIRESTSRRGWTPEQTESLCQMLLAFSRYSFNKSHSYAYAELGYITMYLKHHHPIEWWTAVLNNEDDEDKLRGFISLLGDRISPPSMKNAASRFLAAGDKIVAPISAIKRVGPKSYAELDEKGPFNSLEDFVKKVNHTKVNIGVMGQLIKARAADELMDQTLPYPEARQKLMDDYYRLRKGIKSKFKPELSNFDPLAIFLMEKDANKSFNKSVLNDKDVVSDIQDTWSDLYKTGKRAIPLMKGDVPILNGELVAKGLLEKGFDKNVGMILLLESSSVKKGISKRGKPYVFTKSILSDGFTTIEGTHWNNEKPYSLPKDTLVYIKGKLQEGWKTNVCINIFELLPIE